ncbi:MAG: NAD(+) diphosphatase [Betaproteobacteria bacterium]|nr:NAD(+) diphosphatase [Betaproteobacteria bacterium]NBP62311.1 NAD(+) diphosphatase [Betaproteobacteria bacterium]NBQ08441.1 NAD(+) diphosphatase [Betaproteobacteria bacterium]NCU99025.1 NAD(+) diphosphatase [Betaproteobacteria bacterium]NCV26571.1 NAD(+) diphosphatase [Betaproteobacteria bacterium]
MILPDTFQAASDEMPAAADPANQSHCFFFYRGSLLVRQDAIAASQRLAHWPVSQADIEALIASPVHPEWASRRFIGWWHDHPCWGLNLSEEAWQRLQARQAQGESADLRFEPLRALFNRLPDEVLAIAGRALQMLEFDRSHRYCGACANPTRLHEGGRSRRCSVCGETSYPRVAPAMMVLIKREGVFGRELLLARSPRFPAGMYSALAGFVEPSESIESCIHRECLEEVGLRVQNLQYFGSQGWPFPHSLMIAYVADYESGEIQCQEAEIEDARWFRLDALPQLPNRLSIARRLIDGVIARDFAGS